MSSLVLKQAVIQRLAVDLVQQDRFLPKDKEIQLVAGLLPLEVDLKRAM